MKTFLKILIVFSSIFLGTIGVHAQSQSCSCVQVTVPSSANVSKSGGTVSFALILYGYCTPCFSVSDNWLTCSYTRQDNTHGLLYVTASANPGTPRTGYVYVDNKMSWTIPINQAGGLVAVTGVTVSPTSALLNINETKYLTPSVMPSNATNKSVTWSSSSTAVATINSYGMVTGITPGTATITATTVDGGYRATSTITVSAMPKSFSWANRNGNCYITRAKNQIDQEPCQAFAAVGVAEAKYKIQFNSPKPYDSYDDIDLAELQFNLYCMRPHWFDIPDVFEKMKTRGVVNESCDPYDWDKMMDPYTPVNCDQPCTSPSIFLKIASYGSIDLASMGSNSRADYLKNIIMQKGTVAISIPASYIHNSDGNHGYELYGWNELNWLLKDSWPNYTPYGNTTLSTSINIPDILASLNRSAYYIESIGSLHKSASVLSKKEETMIENSALDEKKNNITIFPNPANTQITLVNFPSKGGFVQIYKIDGSLVFSKQISSNQIDVSGLAKGFYIVKLTKNNEDKVLNFVKQ